MFVARKMGIYSTDGQLFWKKTNENIGHISFCRLYEKVNAAEIEYCIGKAFWNNGYIIEAVKAFIEYTFQNTVITKLEAFHRIENPASGKVLQKVGMKQVDNVLRFFDLPKAPDGDISYGITKIWHLINLCILASLVAEI